MSNDLETFSPNVLAIEDISEFMTFLKNLCLKLIIEGESNIKFKDFDKLKDISISLLNQLYLRNLRLEFVDTDFWKLTEVNFNLDQMLKIIIDEEAKRAENKTEEGEEEEDEEDEEIEDEEMEEADEGIGGDGDWWDIENDVNIDNENKMGKEFDILPPSLTTAKLEILNKLPFFVPFKDRVKIFQTLIALDRQRFQEQQGLSYYNPFQNRLKADIRREFLLEDAFNLFRLAGINFKHQLSVTFFNEYGGQEAGIDGGGITKEFLTSVVTEGFNPQNKLQLFQETSLNQIYPNEEISLSLQKKIEPVIQQEKLSYLRFLGTIIGKCFYENVLIDILFAPFFLTKWCNANRGISLKNSINDLNYLDSEFFQNLMKLTAMNDEELKELDLNFTINQIINGEQYKFNLIPDGETIMVDATNRLQYIHQVSNFKLNQSLHIQTKYFLEGLFELISSNWLCMFDAFELQMLILGGESDVNIQDWKDNVVYHGYFDDDITIVLFWEVVSEMTAKERFLLVKFATSVSRAPLLGFGSLHPKFAITHAGRSNERLPTASTCVNSLKLPDYQDKRIIKEKLLYAINNDARFDLS